MGPNLRKLRPAKLGKRLRILAKTLAGHANRLLGRRTEALRWYGSLIPEAPFHTANLRRIDHLACRGEPDAAELFPCNDAVPDHFALFIGYPRSGHSLVGSLLDAHPHITLAHELHALRQVRRGVPPDALRRYIRYNAIGYAQFGRSQTGYSYEVPGQYQGFTGDSRVLGDKKGGGSAGYLRKHPELLQRLEDGLECPLRFVHVVRNPFDNIATMARRAGRSLADARDHYFRLADSVAELKGRYPAEAFLDIYLDDFIADPRGELDRAAGFFGLTTEAAYREACAGLVYPAPNPSRDQVAWDPTLVADIRARCSQYPFLARFDADHAAPR